LLRYVRTDETVKPTWLPIEFAVPDRWRRVPLLHSNWSVRASLLAHQDIRRARRKTKLDAIFYHTQVTSLLSTRITDLPTIISLDATPLNYDTVGAFYGHTAGGPLEKLKFRLNKRALDHAEALVTWCQWAKDSLVADYGVLPEKVTVIPPGVDLAQWPRHTGDERVRAAEGRQPRLLFVGGDFERKGGNVLLDAFTRNLQDMCELSIVTQSPVAPARNLKVYHNVTPNSDTLLRLYADADIFVFPSLADCAPLAIPEAMAASLPIVTTRVGAIPEMVTDGAQGLMVAPGDVDALTSAIRRLLDAPDLRAHMGDRGRATVEDEYDARRNTHRLLNVLKSATDRAHRLPPPTSEVYALAD
ncbi:MAG: glycosyltransferase family 4 protein, partial [Ktedonobacterales bacterium]